MNFQAVQQANGQMITMFGTIVEFKGEGVNPKSQKPYKKVAITDDSGVKHNVTLRGNLPDPSLLNQRAQFSLNSYQGNHQGQPYTGYSGFWNNQAQVAPQGQPSGAAQGSLTYTPVNQPQGQQQPPQQAYTPPVKPASRDYDKENRGKCRFGFYQAAITMGMTPVQLVADMPTLNAIEKLVDFSMEGFDVPVNLPSDSSPPPAEGESQSSAYDDGSEIPF